MQNWFNVKQTVITVVAIAVNIVAKKKLCDYRIASLHLNIRSIDQECTNRQN